MRTKNSYPKDRLYCLIPIKYKSDVCGSKDVEVRINKLKTLFFWDFSVNDSKLNLVKNIEGVKIMTHSEAIIESAKLDFAVKSDYI